MTKYKANQPAGIISFNGPILSEEGLNLYSSQKILKAKQNWITSHFQENQPKDAEAKKLKRKKIVAITNEEVARAISTVVADKAPSYDGILDQIFSSRQLN